MTTHVCESEAGLKRHLIGLFISCQTNFAVPFTSHSFVTLIWLNLRGSQSWLYYGDFFAQSLLALADAVCRQSKRCVISFLLLLFRPLAAVIRGIRLQCYDIYNRMCLLLLFCLLSRSFRIATEFRCTRDYIGPIASRPLITVNVNRAEYMCVCICVRVNGTVC